MPRTAAWMEPGVTRAQLRDPETNLRIGFKYLRYLLDKYEGDERPRAAGVQSRVRHGGPGAAAGRNPDNGYADFVRGKRTTGTGSSRNR
jgi:soluble lytic murein transglycosylase-like protein